MKIIGYDTSESANTISVLCTKHGNTRSGSPIAKGDEWASMASGDHCCARCGRDLADDGLVILSRLDS